MVYTEMTVKAMKMAYGAHHGQVDANGVPYIFHPCHLAEQMDDEICCTVAWLHDVVEDTALTFADLEREFPAAVVSAVRLLTHEDGEAYPSYLARIKENPVAKRVKLADVMHNSDRTRNAGVDVPEEKLRAWDAKYALARKILTD